MVNFGFDVNDLIKNKRVSAKHLALLEEWAEAHEMALISNLNQQQLAIFLIACDGDTELVKKCAVGYVQIRSETPDVFANRNCLNADVVTQLETVKFCIIPTRTDANRTIIINKIYDPNPGKYHMDVAMKYLFMLYDSLLYKDPPDGVIVLFDMANTSVRHITRTKLHLLKVLCTYVQHHMPLKIQGIHIMNALWFLPKFLGIIRPFMHLELMDKVHVHLKDDLSEFYSRHIPQTHLPSDYGGFLPSVEELHVETFDNLILLNGHFAEQEAENQEIINNTYCT